MSARQDMPYGATIVTFGLLLLFALQSSTALAQIPDGLTQRARESIVHIDYQVPDGPRAPRTVSGTGFVVSANGYLLTAAHLFREWRALSDDQRRQVTIHGSIFDRSTNADSPQYTLTIVDLGDADGYDVALLKLPETATIRSSATICLSRPDPAVTTGEQIFAFGFPFNQGFQPVSGHLGTPTAPGDRWFAESPFTYGMSGGPVYSATGFVMGLVNGGLDGTEAVRYITPIRHASRLLQRTSFREICDGPGEPVIGRWEGTYVCHDGWGSREGSSTLEVKRNRNGRIVGSERFSRGILSGSAQHEIVVESANHYRFKSQVTSFPSFTYEVSATYSREAESLAGRYFRHPNCDSIVWRRDRS